MAGGSGTRFWPLSRESKPKQYLNLFGSESLIQSTINRFSGICSTDNIYVVSNENQKEILEQQTKMLPLENLIYEPVGKNTLPCIGLAAIYAEIEDPDGIMIVSPADHSINKVEGFRDSILAATKIAGEEDTIVTIGIKPEYPATGYGYIRVDEDQVVLKNNLKHFKVDRFVEKPDLNKARKYIAENNYYWNSGLFIFKISVFLNEVRRFAPLLYHDLKRIQSAMGTPTFKSTLNDIYGSLDSISIDYGIMEHTDKINLVEGCFEWNDLGSWESVYLLNRKDDFGNVGNSRSVFIDSKNSYVHTNDSLVTLVGLDNVIVVQEGNKILVCDRSSTEDIKKVVEHLRLEGQAEYL